MLRHLGGVGVFILAALDSSVRPTLGAVDALTIVLAGAEGAYAHRFRHQKRRQILNLRRWVNCSGFEPSRVFCRLFTWTVANVLPSAETVSVA